MEHSADVLFVGGGVIGLTAAYYLARDGVRVRIVDKGDLSQEASWAGAGIIPPGNLDEARTPFDRLRALSTGMFPGLSEELRGQTGIDNGYRRCGGLEFVKYESVAANEWHGEGVRVEALDEAAALRLEPSLAKGQGGVLYVPDMAQVRNPRHVKALVAGCRKLGVELSPGCVVHGFLIDAGRVIGVKTSAGDLRAAQVVLTTGAWTDPLLEPLGWRPGIHPVRGQIALLRPSSPVLQHILVRGSQYLVPRDDGRVLAGSTEENVGFDKNTTAAGIDNLLQLAMSLVPALAEAPLEKTWAGLRPGNADGLPYIGPVPGIDNLFVAAGHFRAGIQLSTGTGQLLKEMLLQQTLSLDIQPFRLRGTA